MPSPQTCGRCGEEIRWGRRDNLDGWWHRENVDHMAVLGVYTPRESLLEQWDGRLWTFGEAPEPEEGAEDGEEGGSSDFEPIEVPSTPVDPKDAPAGPKRLANLGLKLGWELVRLTYARGPYMGANGKSLGVSDVHVVALRRGRLGAVAYWRDGKAVAGWLLDEDGWLDRVGISALQNWMKEKGDG